MGSVKLITSSRAVEDAATLITELLVAPGSRKRLGVAGGSAVKAIAAIRLGLGARWKEVSLTWVDERIVPQASDDSNRGAAYRAKALSVDDSPRVELPLVRDGEDGEMAVRRVTMGFARDFAGSLDVALLGMGEDGHVASLFPGHRLLGEVNDDFAWLDDSPKPPKGRVTMTRKVLSQPNLNRIVLATGEGKRAALHKLLHGDSTLPMGQLGPLTVITDQRFTAQEMRNA